VIIQTNKYFSEKSWKTILDNQFSELISKFTFEFVSKSTDLANQIGKYQMCFSINLPGAKLPKTLEFIYIGISDLDFQSIISQGRKLKIITSKGLASKLIAEHTLMTCLSLVRNFPMAIIAQKNRSWSQTWFLDQGIRFVSEYKIGIIGLGANGKEIASLFKSLGCTVFGASRTQRNDVLLDSHYSFEGLDAMYGASDIIIVSLPLRDETKHLISERELKMIGQDSYLINISRGPIINEADLISALSNNTIRGAALDVYDQEPLNRKSKLWKLPNVILTPHIAGNINLIARKIQADFYTRLKDHA